MKNNTVLIGFMGSGKSTIARELQLKNNNQLIEMDELILKKSGKKLVTDIFLEMGEIGFRELEILIAKELQNSTNAIISTGGGVVMNKIILDYLKNTGEIIYLKTSFSEIQQRIGSSSDRPLFRNLEEAEKLYHLREPLYEAYADIIINTDTKSPDVITKEILERSNDL